jgi:hypothetical protein
MNVNGQGRSSRLLFVLPALHFCIYAFSLVAQLFPSLQFLGIVGTFVMAADLPVSLVAYGLAWKFPILASAWILVAGTVWWYLLSRAIAFLVRRFRT